MIDAGLPSVHVLDLVEIWEDDYPDHEILTPDMFHEFRALDAVDPEHPDLFLTLGCSLAYNRNAERLWDNVMELHERYPAVFSYGNDIDDELYDIMTDIGFRFGTTDRDIIAGNYRSFDSFGTVLEFFEMHDFHAPTIFEAIKNAEMVSHLGGQKIGPFWLRVMHERVHPLDEMYDLPIPVDTHIRKLSQKIIGREVSDDRIREYWSWIAEEHGQSALSIDRYLWLIGSQWDEGGSDYWDACVAAVV